MNKLVSAGICLLLASCGGGGGGGTSTQTQAINRSPVLVDPGALTVREGTASVTILSASDPDNGSLSFSIISGEDEALFTLSPSGQLSFSAPPNYESPGDSGANNVYEVTIQVSDGSLSDNQSVEVTVLDAFEGRVVDAPISGASVFIDLNGDNDLNEGEPTGVTDVNGFFSVDTFTRPENGGAKVVSKGGTDTKTGKALPDLALISDVPVDITESANVTPLTTIIAAVDTTEAKAALLAAMGITSSPEDLLTKDGWAAAQSGDEDAKQAQRVNQQVGLLLQTAALVIEDGEDSTDVSVSLAQSVGKQISAAVSSGAVDLTSKEVLQEVLSKAAAEVAPDLVIETSAIEAVAQSVANVNTVVSDLSLDPLSDLAAEVVQAAQESFETSVSAVISGTVSVSEFSRETDTAELFSDVALAADAPDNDGDGISDQLDPDDDNDGVRDSSDVFPKIALDGRTDTDGDGRPNNCDVDCVAIGMTADLDDDADGVLDADDKYPQVSLGKLTDTDRDGIPDDCDSQCTQSGMTADFDDDNDGITDVEDVEPTDASKPAALDWSLGNWDEVKWQ